MEDLKFKLVDNKNKKLVENIVDIKLTNKTSEISLQNLKFIDNKNNEFEINKNCGIIRFTGIKDKNNVDLYEYDIVSNGFNTWEIKYNNGTWWMFKDDKPVRILYKFISKTNTITKIGNKLIG